MFEFNKIRGLQSREAVETREILALGLYIGNAAGAGPGDKALIKSSMGFSDKDPSVAPLPKKRDKIFQLKGRAS